MVFPVLFLALIALLMLSMYTYQTVVIYHTASKTAERTAFRWDNSARDPVSGIGPTGQYDGLYWRMADNGALKTLFDFGGEGEGGGGGGVSMVIGTDLEESGEERSLPEHKMSSESGRIGTPFEGEVRYYGTIEKRVELKLRQPLSIPLLDSLLGHSEPMTKGSASIVDPVELIRNVDLVRYYAAKFKGGPNGDQRKQAQVILGDRQASKS